LCPFVVRDLRQDASAFGWFRSVFEPSANSVAHSDRASSRRKACFTVAYGLAEPKPFRPKTETSVPREKEGEREREIDRQNLHRYTERQKTVSGHTEMETPRCGDEKTQRYEEMEHVDTETWRPKTWRRRGITTGSVEVQRVCV